MRKTSILTGCAMLLGLASGNAAAQYYGNQYGHDADQVIRCESNDGRWRQCNTGGNRDVQIVRQLSDRPCIEGRTWGTDGGGLWVTQGCRAEFRVGYDNYANNSGYGNDYGNGQVFRCESKDGRNRQCPLNVSGTVLMVRQLSSSPCVQGQTWGQSQNGVWVTRGCRADFQVQARRRNQWNRWSNQSDGYANANGGQTLRCESRDERTSRCGANVYRGVQLMRQHSQSPCIEGQTWGWDREGVWVRNGCRADFTVW